MLAKQPQPNVTLAILHGSRATGTTHEHSDWDVGVLAGHALRTDERSELRRAFAQKLGVSEERIDISDLGADAPLLSASSSTRRRLLLAWAQLAELVVDWRDGACDRHTAVLAVSMPVRPTGTVKYGARRACRGLRLARAIASSWPFM